MKKENYTSKEFDLRANSDNESEEKKPYKKSPNHFTFTSKLES